MFVGYLEKVDPRIFASNGTANGIVTLSTTSGFKSNQKVVITSNTQSTLNLIVKHVNSDTELVVGPSDNNPNTRTDISAYLVADNSQIRATYQTRFAINPNTIQRAVYEEEPTVAIRNVLVDEFGRKITSTKTGGKIALDVNVLSAPPPSLGSVVDVSNQIAVGINNAGYTTILDYPIAAGKKLYLQKINASISAPAAEVEVVFISGGSTIVRHYFMNSGNNNVFDELPNEKEFIGGAGVILRVQAQVAGNVHPNLNCVGWASINGYEV